MDAAKLAHEASRVARRNAQKVVAAQFALERGGARESGNPLSRPEYADVMGSEAFYRRQAGHSWGEIARALLHIKGVVHSDDRKQVKRWARRWRLSDDRDYDDSDLATCSHCSGRFLPAHMAVHLPACPAQKAGT